MRATPDDLWIQRLRQKYSWFPRDVSCGSGWEGPIQELCERIQKYLNAHPAYAAEFFVTQCKEKYGHLCLYTFPECDEIESLIAEAATPDVCELCGAAGQLREIYVSDGSTQLGVLCDSCATK